MRAVMIVFMILALINTACSASAIVYDICDGMSDETASYDDFMALFEAIQKGDCNEAFNVKTAFSLSKMDFEEIALEYDMIDNEGKGLVMYRNGTPVSIGAGAILVYGNDGDFPVKLGDRIHIWSSGRPADIIIEVSMEGCNPYDDDCEEICAYEDDNVCDPMCYGTEWNHMQCDMDCVDINANGVIDSGDRDGICDPDCYNDDYDPEHSYDPDCVEADVTDNLCDPDSNGVRDGVCDLDCAPGNHHCDFDCDGTNGPKDPDCYECDGTCNGFCSYECTEIDKDPDCPEGFTGWYDLSECCGNGKCEAGENCFACTTDCPPDENGVATDCSSYNVGVTDNFFCCPLAYNADSYGCANLTADKEEGDECYCGPECGSGLSCGGPDGDKHCCPEGTMWDGTECASGDVLIVALKSNLEGVYSASVLTDQLEPRIELLIDAMAQDGLAANFLYLDTEEVANMTPGGAYVTDPTNWQNIDSVLDALLAKMGTKYLLIIGGYRTFPFPEYNTGACWDPYYPVYQTDDPYADFNPIDNMPDIAIGRIPDPNNGDISVILNALDTYITLHNNGGIDLSNYGSVIMPRAFSGCPCASSGSCFNENTFGVVCFDDERCHRETSSYDILNDHKFVSILMHGSDSTPQMFQYDPPCGGAFVMTSNNVPNINVDDSLWMVMACYSTYLKNKATTGGSIPLQFLRNGGAVYMGGSLTQMGNIYDCNNCPALGDYYVGSLYQFIGNNMKAGTRIGDAYIKGKVSYMTDDIPDPDSCNARQGHENMMFGDPTLNIKSVI